MAASHNSPSVGLNRGKTHTHLPQLSYSSSNSPSPPPASTLLSSTKSVQKLNAILTSPRGGGGGGGGGGGLTTTTTTSIGDIHHNNKRNHLTMGNGHHSKTTTSSTTGSSLDSIRIDNEIYTSNQIKSLIQNLKEELIVSKENNAKLARELSNSQKQSKLKDEEIHQLQREVDKLTSVLEKKVGNLLATNSALQSINEESGMVGQVSIDNSNVRLDRVSSATTNRNKKQGVSGESGSSNNLVELKYHEKDLKARQIIKEALQENQFLKHMDAGQIREVVECMSEQAFPLGTYLIREGDPGKHLFVSSEGKLEVIKDDKILGVIDKGKAFGELALLYDCPRTASVKAITNAKVWMLDRQVFQGIMMKTTLQQTEESLKFLKSVPLLKSLPREKLAKIADVLEKDYFEPEQYIVREGEVGQTFFIIKSGQVRVTQLIQGVTEPQEVRRLAKGDYFGEKSLLSDDTRSANVIAMEPGVEALILDRKNFIHLIGDLNEWKEKDYGDASRGAQSYLRKSSDLHKSLNIPTINSKNAGPNVELENPYRNVKIEDLERLTTLGMGGFGRVELVQWRIDKSKTFALKCLKKQHIVQTKQQHHVMEEKNILLRVNCSFVIRLYKTYRDKKYVYMLLEYCPGGEVWTILREKGNFDDTTSKFMIGCVLEAFDYLHSNGIIYRDLKPENLLLDSRGFAKLCDFGFAKLIGVGRKTWTFCGTPEYVAPEIVLNKGHDYACDYWSLGVLLFELLTGNPPFTGNDPMRIYNVIIKGIGVIDFPKTISANAHDLIKKLCRENAAERLGYGRGGIDDIRRHKYLQGFDWAGLKRNTVTPPIVPVIKSPSDSSNFDSFPKDNERPPDETSGWDNDF